MAKYEVWDKTSVVYCPNGAKYTPEQWIEKHPLAGDLKTVCAAGEIKGAIFGVFSVMVANAQKAGCDFSACESDQDYLDVIEAFEDEKNKPSGEPTAAERTAAAVELMALASMPDVEVVE